MMVLPLVVVTDAMIVESSLFETAPTTYAAGTTFALNAYASVAGLLGEIKIYRSLQAGNIGNTPASSPTWWVYSSSTFEVHDISKLYYPLNYKVTDLATHSIYICNVANGSYRPLDPISNPTWLALTTPTPALPAAFLAGTTYAFGSLVYYDSTGTIGGVVAAILAALGLIVSGNVPVVNNRGVYRSLVNSNTGNSPPTSPSQWELVYDYPVPHTLDYNFPVGQIVKDEIGKTFKCNAALNSGCPLSNAAAWIRFGPSNKYAAFDVQTSTQSVANKSFSATITPGIIEAVGLINCLGDTATATLRDGLGGAVVWTQSSGIAGEQVSDWYQYFFNDPTIQRTQLLFTGIPPYNNGHLTVTITGGGTVAVGDLLPGRWRDVGLTGFGLQVGITDFSVVKDDDFGATIFTKRGNKKYMNSRDWVKKEGFNRAFNLLRQLPATPCLWLAGDVFDYSEALMLKAFYKDFFIDFDSLDEAYCTLKLIGTI